MQICLFDIDGTLIHTAGAGRKALIAAMRSEFGITEPRDEVSTTGRTDRAIARDIFELHGLADSPQTWDRFREAYLRHLPEMLASSAGQVLPGILELLDELAARDEVAVGLLTGNTAQGAEIKLGFFELFHHFPFGSFGDTAFDRNDVARAALEIVRQEVCADAAGEQIWIIGDTPLDVQCARAIGARAVAVATGWHSAEELEASQPDLLLSDFSHRDSFFALWG